MQKGIPPHLDSIIVIYFIFFGKTKEKQQIIAAPLLYIYLKVAQSNTFTVSRSICYDIKPVSFKHKLFFWNKLIPVPSLDN